MNVDVLTEKYVKMTPNERSALHAVLNQNRVTPYPYYSQTRHMAIRAGAGPFTYAIAQGTLIRAFSYAQGTGDAATAGFPAGLAATIAQTNLSQPGQTVSGQNVEVKGIACQFVPSTMETASQDIELFSDARVYSALGTAAAISLSLNGGENSHKLGILGMIPGAGGFQGGGVDQLGTQPLDGGRPTFPFATNGWPTRSNVFHMKEGIVWRKQSEPDSQLNILVETLTDITLYSGGDPDNNLADEAAAAGVRGYTYPAELGATLMWFLAGRVIGKRGRTS